MNDYHIQGSLDQQLEKLYLVIGGHIFFQTLSAAVQLDLFTLLSNEGPLTRATIASRLDIEAKPARILLLGCTALGLVRKEGDYYRNSEIAQRFLTRDTPGNMVPIVEWQHFINYQPLYYFFEAIRANRNVGLEVFEGHEATLYERLAHKPALEEIFQNAMEAISAQANAMLAANIDFSRVKHLVDVGGGNGANILSLARKNPRLHATVFDSESVCQIATQNIAKAGLSDRLNAVAGNCFQDEFPAGIDAILFCHFFTIWSEEQNRELLDKCYRSLPADGSVIIFNMMQSDDEAGPLTAAIGSPYFLTLATGDGMLYTWSEYQTWMREAGFASIEVHKLPRDHGVIIGRKA